MLKRYEFRRKKDKVSFCFIRQRWLFLVDRELFKEALSGFASGVCVVTTQSKMGDLTGVTISSFSSLSLEPPMVLFCLNDKAESKNSFLKNDSFNVHVLNAAQKDLSETFAKKHGNRWEGVDFERFDDGKIIFKGALVNLFCQKKECFAGGDHTIFTGQVLHVSSMEKGSPLIYFQRGYHQL